MTNLYKSRPARWPQVSLKAFFVLVMLLGWLGAQVKWIRDRHAVPHLNWEGNCAPAPWSISILGEPGCKFVGVQYLGDTRDDDERVRQIQRLFPEATVELVDVDDYGKKHDLPPLLQFNP